MITRRIIHIDMDAFYASIEQRDTPSLRHRPIAVGRSESRGVVAAASYEARRYGVHSAMPSHTAKRLCPHLTFIPPHPEKYRAISKDIHTILTRYTPLIQPLALDEAYLDVTDHLHPFKSATAVAQAICRDILHHTHLTASAGVSYNRFLAKLASDKNKPHGLCVITPHQGPKFVASLPIEAFHGIGPATSAKMHTLGIHTGADLRDFPFEELRAHFKTSALFYHNIAHGIDDRPVEPHRLRKSIGTETTFHHDLHYINHIQPVLEQLSQKIWTLCQEHHLTGRTVTLKIRYTNFQTLTRAHSVRDPINSPERLGHTALYLLKTLLPFAHPIRLLGMTISGLVSLQKENSQLRMSFFDTNF